MNLSWVSFVFAGIEACRSCKTCYPPWSIFPLFTGSCHLKRERRFDQRLVWIMRQNATDELEIWDRPFESSAGKNLDAASQFESFFSVLLKHQQSVGEIAIDSMYTGASVFDRHQKLCLSAACLDMLANLQFGYRTTAPARRCCPFGLKMAQLCHSS